MQEPVEVNGIVIKSEPIGEYDRRVVILTKERGKITAFAKGARKPNSRFVASTNAFSYGVFRLYEGRNSYTLNDALISNYFEELRSDITTAYYGMYFLEVADYYTRENNDELDVLKLVYMSLRALSNVHLNSRLIRAVFEVKIVMINGEFPFDADKGEYTQDIAKTLDYIYRTVPEKLYTFVLSEEVLNELIKIAESVMRRTVGKKFTSLQMLEVL